MHQAFWVSPKGIYHGQSVHRWMFADKLAGVGPDLAQSCLVGGQNSFSQSQGALL